MAERAFLIDRTKEVIYLNGQTVTFERFFQEAGNPGQDGLNAFELWAKLPENAGKTISDFFKSLKGKDGRSPYNVMIESSEGSFFKETDGVKKTTLKALIIHAETGAIAEEDYANFKYMWKQNGSEVLVNADGERVGVFSGQQIPFGIFRTILLPGRAAKRIVVGTEDVQNKAIFTCDIYLAD